MKLRLLHLTTSKRLHSHEVRPPVSDVDFQNEVSAYGMPNFAGDANDDWILEIDQGDSRDRESSKRLRTLRTKFRLRHVLTGCYLFSHKVKLPDWAFEQQEVTCNKNAVRENSLWFVETATHPNRKSSLWSSPFECLNINSTTQCLKMRPGLTTSSQASLPNFGNFNK